MRTLLLFILLLASRAEAGQGDNAVDAFRRYDYVRERTNHNDHPVIDKMLDYCGVPRGNPWCAASAVYVYAEGNAWKKVLPRYARVSALLKYCRRNSAQYEVFSNRDILRGAYTKKPGDLIVWLYGSGPNPNGHIEVLTDISGKWATLNNIGGNTVSGDQGNQRGEGGAGDPVGGVYYRARNWSNVAAIIRVKE